MYTIDIYHYKNSLMYVLSVCTALQFPAPTADTALTLTSYSVPAVSGTMVEFRGGEPEMVCSLPQKVVPCVLYWIRYWEMGSSLCGMVQFARKAGNFDDTALDRDKPMIWAGTPKTDRRNYVTFHYHRGTIHAVLLCIAQETQTEWHVHSIRRHCSQIPETPYHHVTLLGTGFRYLEWHNINDLFLQLFLLYQTLITSSHKLPAGAKVPLGTFVHRSLKLTTLTEVIVV